MAFKREIGLFCVLVLLSSLLACKRSFVRSAEILDLGPPRFLMEATNNRVEEALLVFFEPEQGWRAMSMRCTLDGCDLTLQDKSIFNPCSRVFYSHEGEVLLGDAPRRLPFYQMAYKDGKLLVNTGKEVSPDTFFLPPEVKARIPKWKELNEKEGVGGPPRIPDILGGQGDGEPGTPFGEPNQIEDDFY